jgi:NitT/TauT family transport system ATP-binding protein
VLVLDAESGRIATRLDNPGPLPRPGGWRADAVFREAVERLAAALAGATPGLAA